MTRFVFITAILLTLSLLVFTDVSAAPRTHRRRRKLAADANSRSDEESPSLYEYCSTGQDSVQNLKCISDTLEKISRDNTRDARTWFTIFASALIFFMQAGFAMLCAGSVRHKNVGNTMLKNLLDAIGAALGFFSIGYAFAFGRNDSGATTFIGSNNFFMIGITDLSAWLFQFAFAATSATIVAGTLAERCQMAAYLCYSVVLTGFLYPVVAHSIWSPNGFLSAFNENPFLGVGVLDFAGSGVVHMTGGSTALFATMILGPRKGRFYDSRGNPLPKPKPFPGHSIALQMLGTFILWFGWYGFNPGSALSLDSDSLSTGEIAALAAVVTTLGGASAGVSALFTNLILEERSTGEAKFDLTVAMNGTLAGLVSITAGSAVIEPWAAVVIGTIAGWLYLAVSKLLIKLRIDDAVDAIPVHLANGMWGLLSVGFFASPTRMLVTYGENLHSGWFYSLHSRSFDAHLLVAQFVGILFIFGWVFFLMFPFFIWLNYMGWFRADALEELVGLDISYHGGGGTHNDEVKQEYVDAFQRKRGRAVTTTETEMPYGEEEEEYQGQPEGYDQGQPYYDDNGGGYGDQGMQDGYPVQDMHQGYPHPNQVMQGGYVYPEPGYNGQPVYEQPTNHQGYDQGYDQGYEQDHFSQGSRPYRQPEPEGPAFNPNLPASFQRR